MAEQKKVRTTIEIHNRPYTIVGTESEQHIKLIGSLVDQKMKEIQQGSSYLDTSSLAVLTAVNTMNDYMKLKEEYASLLGAMRKGKEE